MAKKILMILLILHKMTSPELEAEIHHCLDGFEHGGTTPAKKSFFKRLVWLEAQREALLGIQAERRYFRNR